MTTVQVNSKQIKILNKPEYMTVLLEIMVGNDYASKIAKDLEKKQPTITEQLNSLEELEIVHVKKRTKAKKYEVNNEIVVEAVYSMIEEFKDFWMEADSIGIFSKERLKKMSRKGIEKSIPPKLILDFFHHYAIGLVDVVGGELRGMGDILRTFFGALDVLDEEEKERLFQAYKITKRNFKEIVHFMSFDTINRARAAILSSIQFMESPIED